MKAIVFNEYGSPNVLHVAEIAKPTPKANEVLIKVFATTVTSAEVMMRRGKPTWGRIIIGLRKPRKRFRTLGTEIAGEVESVGQDVKRFKKRDQVFGFTGFTLGANAEYNSMPEKGSLSIKPTNKSYEESAAAVDGATTSFYFLKEKGNIQAGQKVLIIGASGSIGTYAVQLAKHFGAEVTGVCSTKNIELVHSLGAEKVIDYTKEDFATNGETYDIIFDTVGKSSFAHCKGSLMPNGCYLPTTGLINSVLKIWTSIVSRKKIKTGMSVEKNEALAFLKQLLEKEQLNIVIDRRYPLEQIAEAHRYVDKGHKKGNVVITVAHTDA